MADKSVHIVVPSPALQVIQLLEDAGFEAWCVGGFVRDSLMELPAHDVDLTSSATWQQLEALCDAASIPVRRIGVKHGTLTVLLDGEALEVTTYRIDGAYSDGRHPDSVSAARSIEEDLRRRDFTINAMAYHPQRGLLDPFGGREDIEQGIIRTVGDPRKRFSEDALRILRACRFASQLGFALETETFEAALSQKNLLGTVAVERVRDEMERFLLGAHVHDALLKTVDILAFPFPELVAMKGCEQRTVYHIYDVLEHTAWAVQNAPTDPILRWTMFFHDMGKPAAKFEGPDGVSHFYGHARISVLLAQAIMDRLSFSNHRQAQIVALVKRHDDVIEPQRRAVRRALSRLNGSPELFRMLCDVKKADASAQAPQCAGRIQLADQLEDVLEEVLAEGEAFSLKSLAVNGRDAMAAGIPQGPMIGAALSAALEAVIEGALPNQREELLGFLEEWVRSQTSAS